MRRGLFSSPCCTFAFMCDYFQSLNSWTGFKLQLHQKSLSALFRHPFDHSSCLLPIRASSSADTAKMTQPLRRDRAHQPAPARKSASLSSPSAARRLYRNLSGKFRVGTNHPGLEDSVVSGRWGDKERLRKTAIVSQKARKTSAAVPPEQYQCLPWSQL